MVGFRQRAQNAESELTRPTFSKLPYLLLLLCGIFHGLGVLGELFVACRRTKMRRRLCVSSNYIHTYIHAAKKVLRIKYCQHLVVDVQVSGRPRKDTLPKSLGLVWVKDNDNERCTRLAPKPSLRIMPPAFVLWLKRKCVRTVLKGDSFGDEHNVMFARVYVDWINNTNQTLIWIEHRQ